MIPCSVTTVGQAALPNSIQTTCTTRRPRPWRWTAGAIGTVPIRRSRYVQHIPALSTQPAREAAQVFAQRLAEHGIAVNSSVEQGTVPEGTSPNRGRAFRIAE